MAVLPLNPFCVGLMVIPALICFGGAFGYLYSRFWETNPKEPNVAMGCVLGIFASVMVCAIMLEGGAVSLTLRPTEAQIVARPATWESYLGKNGDVLPKRIVAKAALQAYGEVEAATDLRTREAKLELAHRLKEQLFPAPMPPMDEADRKAMEALKPVAGDASIKVPAPNAGKPVVDEPSQIAQLRLLADGN